MSRPAKGPLQNHLKFARAQQTRQYKMAERKAKNKFLGPVKGQREFSLCCNENVERRLPQREPPSGSLVHSPRWHSMCSALGQPRIVGRRYRKR